MPLRRAEAFILRTYPLRESDKIVSFFTREYGKCRGVARGARRPKSKFGSMLEPMSQVQVQFFERESGGLANIDHCELVASMMVAAGGADLLHSMAVALMVEVADRMLPEREANDAVYRLLALVLPAMRSADEAACWLPLSYFLFWMVRLGGFLPRFTEDDLSPEGLHLAEAIARTPLAELPPGLLAACAALPGARLRRRLCAAIEDQIESNLRSWPMLAQLEAALEPNI